MDQDAFQIHGNGNQADWLEQGREISSIGRGHYLMSFVASGFVKAKSLF